MATNSRRNPAVIKSSEEAPGLGRLVGFTAAIMCTTVLVVVTAALFASGVDLLPAMGIAFFAAAWGGGGFSAMIGGVIYASRLENETLAARAVANA